MDLTNKGVDIGRGLKRAEKFHCSVEQLTTEGWLFRVQSATTTGRWYLVELILSGDRILGRCDCLAGLNSTVCHHLASACQTMIDTNEAVAAVLEPKVDYVA